MLPALAPRPLPLRIVNDVALVLRNLDQMLTAVETPDGRVVQRPVTIRLGAEARLALAKNLVVFGAAFDRMVAREAELARSLGGSVADGVVRLPNEKLAAFSWARAGIQDVDETLAWHEMSYKDFSFTEHLLPLTAMVYLLNLVEPGSLARRFSNGTKPWTATRQQAIERLAALLDLEGRKAYLDQPAVDGQPARRQEVRIPFIFAPELREILAFNAFQCYLVGVEPPRKYRQLVVEQGASDPANLTPEQKQEVDAGMLAWLGQTIEVQTIPFASSQLVGSGNQIPLPNLALLAPLLVGD